MQDRMISVLSPNGDKSYISMEEFSKKLNFANLSQIKLRDLENNKDYNPTYTKYTKSEVVSYLENPATNEKNLRKMSEYLYNVSNYYRRLIGYFATMSTFSYIIVPYGIDYSKSVNKNKFKKAYYNVASTLERMNIAHEFPKALVTAFKNDVYYGVVWESADSFSLQQLDADRCKISSVEDGVYNFAFDFSYFDSYKERLPNFPPEFTTMYNAYKSNTSKMKWQEIPAEMSICLKVNEDSYVPVPPFVSLFSALADIEDYRAISKNASETSNYKALCLEIPTDDNGSYLIPYNMCLEFYNMLCNVLPSNIGAFMSPMKVSSWDFDKSGAMADTDVVDKAESSMWAQAGVNKLLFGGGDDPSSSTLSLSTVNDQMIVFNMMRQIERWINRKLKFIGGAYKFKIHILDVTHFNKDNVHDKLVKDGQYGMPVRSAIMAVNGYTPGDTQNMQYLENTILDLSANEVPLISSNVQSGTGESGRPTNESVGKALSDSGEADQEAE